MGNLKRIGFGLLLLLGFMMLWGCGGGSNRSQVRLVLTNLGQLSSDLNYAAWAERGGTTGLISTFNTDSNNSANFSGFSIFETLSPGDRIFVTIESKSNTNPQIPSNRIVLDGRISVNTAVLTFPRMQEFQNAQGFITVSAGNRQILAEFFNLPDVSDLGFVYQGFLVRDVGVTPLQQFNFNEVPVSDTVGFDVTTAQYFLSVEPVPDFDPNNAYTIRPFATNGNLLPIVRQQLVRSSLTPGSVNFNFPSGVATIR